MESVTACNTSSILPPERSASITMEIERDIILLFVSLAKVVNASLIEIPHSIW